MINKLKSIGKFKIYLLVYIILGLITWSITSIVFEPVLVKPDDNPYHYKLYITDTDLYYVDGKDTIYTEKVDWVNPSPLHQAIINDNE
jgi:hypothetical protein